MYIVSERKDKEVELTGKKLDNYNKALELKLKLQESRITLSDLDKFVEPLELLSSCSSSMQIVPLNTVNETDIPIVSESFETDNEEETT